MIDPTILFTVVIIFSIVLGIIISNIIDIKKSIRFRNRYPEVTKYVVNKLKYKYIVDNINYITEELLKDSKYTVCTLYGEKMEYINFIIKKVNDDNTGLDIGFKENIDDVRIVYFEDGYKIFDFVITNKLEEDKFDVLTNLSKDELEKRLDFLFDVLNKIFNLE